MHCCRKVAQETTEDAFVDVREADLQTVLSLHKVNSSQCVGITEGLVKMRGSVHHRVFTQMPAAVARRRNRLPVNIQTPVRH